MNSNEDRIWTELVNTLWAEIEALTSGTVANRLALGQRFYDLRSKYSDRNFGGHRLTSGHGSFEEEIRKRGYRKMVKGLISALNQLGRGLTQMRPELQKDLEKELQRLEP